MNPELLLRVTALALLLLLSSSTSDDQESCEPKSCGNGVNISFPFWINGQHPSYCGFPQFEVNCSGQTPVLAMIYNQYHVRDIFYNNQSLLDTVTQINEPTSCPLPFYNLSFSLTPFTISASNRGLYLLRHCEGSPLGSYEVGCDKGGTFAYIGGGYWSPEHPGSSNKCGNTTVVPVVVESAVKGSDYKELLESGFLLEWSAANCTECRASKGQCGYNEKEQRFMCICHDGIQATSCNVIGFHPSHFGHKSIIGAKAAGDIWDLYVNIILSVFLLAMFLSPCFLLYCCSKKILNWIILVRSNQEIGRSIKSFLEKYESIAPKRYTYPELKKITKSFGVELGKGGFGVVYKGSLNDDYPEAVKVLDATKTEDGKDFINEIASIGRTSHVNVVSLLGFCYEGTKRALVYDFMPNGSLDRFIYPERSEVTITPLGWENLFKIAVGIARGLEYLHRGCNTRIVHFDIKPHNILLDHDLCPKISDFGLAKLCKSKESVISMCGTRGTIGYIAPEVFSWNFGVVSSKSDVYSYGMMVLEMVGGREKKKIVVAGDGSDSDVYFPHWIYRHLDRDGGELRGWCGVTSETEEVARKMILVGLWCIQTRPDDRPSIRRVLEMLEGNIGGLEMPPEPHLSSPVRTLISSLSVSLLD